MKLQSNGQQLCLSSAASEPGILHSEVGTLLYTASVSPGSCVLPFLLCPQERGRILVVEMGHRSFQYYVYSFRNDGLDNFSSVAILYEMLLPALSDNGRIRMLPGLWFAFGF